MSPEFSHSCSRLIDAFKVIGQEVGKKYGPQAREIDRTDGISMDMGEWRFNLRQSNTEPVIRLNVESRADQALMEEKTADILALLDG